MTFSFSILNVLAEGNGLNVQQNHKHFATYNSADFIRAINVSFESMFNSFGSIRGNIKKSKTTQPYKAA